MHTPPPSPITPKLVEEKTCGVIKGDSPKKVVLKAPTKLDNPRMKKTKKKKNENVPNSQIKITEMFKKKEKISSHETPCNSGQFENKKITKPHGIGVNTTDGEAFCMSSDGFPDVGESYPVVGGTIYKPDLAIKLSLSK